MNEIREKLKAAEVWLALVRGSGAAKAAYGLIVEALALLPQDVCAICSTTPTTDEPPMQYICKGCVDAFFAKSVPQDAKEPTPSSEKELREALIQIEKSDRAIEAMLGEPTFNQRIARAALASSPEPEAPK